MGRFMPYNGMLSKEQLFWLKLTLSSAAASQESVVVLSHAPFCPGACDPLCLIWNYQEVLDIVKDCGSVVAVLAGHDHEGGYKHHDGVHHLTFPSPLLCTEEEVAFATVEVHRNKMIVKGEGGRLPKCLNMPFYSDS